MIPGEVRLTVELRDLSSERLRTFANQIAERAQAIAKETRTQIAFNLGLHNEGAVTSGYVQEQIQHTAKALGLNYEHLPSGAGHDAQMMARVGDMGMIFVPSVKGISHSPQELTHWQDCANGGNLLLQTVLRLADS